MRLPLSSPSGTLEFAWQSAIERFPLPRSQWQQRTDFLTVPALLVRCSQTDLHDPEKFQYWGTAFSTFWGSWAFLIGS